MMNMLKSCAIALCLTASPAFAMDACLIGNWKPTNNGGADFMKQERMVTESRTSMAASRMELKADGTYVQYGGNAKAEASTNVGTRIQSDGGNLRIAGEWSSGKGLLKLKPTGTAGEAKGSQTGDGFKQKVGSRFTGWMMKTFGKSEATYTCTAKTLETVQKIKGAKGPMVQRYRRG